MVTIYLPTLKNTIMHYTGKNATKICSNGMRIKHPRLEKNEQGHIMFHTPSQNKNRNTDCLYDTETNELWIAGKQVEKHPKFKDVVQFENWCNRYYANGKDEK